MNAMMQIVCSACGAKNRVPKDKLNHVLACGRCGVDLLKAEPFTLSDATLARYLAGTDFPVVVDFWADWCGPCKAMAPHFKNAAAKLTQVRFAKVDTEASPQLSQQYAIRSIPTLILFHQCLEVARQTGSMGEGDLSRWITTQLQLKGVQ